MPRVEWINVGSEFGIELEVYINDAPSAQQSAIFSAITSTRWQLTLQEYRPQEL